MPEEYTTELAIITEASVTFERGFFVSIRIRLDYGCAGQCFGMMVLGKKLDRTSASNTDLRGAVYGMEVIRATMEAFGVERFCDIEGRVVWAEHSHCDVRSLTTMKWEGSKTICPSEIAALWGIG